MSQDHKEVSGRAIMKNIALGDEEFSKKNWFLAYAYYRRVDHTEVDLEVLLRMLVTHHECQRLGYFAPRASTEPNTFLQQFAKRVASGKETVSSVLPFYVQRAIKNAQCRA
jgi:hypothetical protein